MVFRFLASFIDNMKFQVEFTINHLPLRLQHRAVELAVQEKLKEVLFPTESNNLPTPMPQLSLRSVTNRLKRAMHFCWNLLEMHLHYVCSVMIDQSAHYISTHIYWIVGVTTK